MKNLFFYSILAITLLGSCNKAPVEPASIVWPDGTGEFAPYTIGSTFNYDYTSANGASNIFTLTVAKDTTIDEHKYYKLESSQPELMPSYFVNYNNGNLTEITYNLNYLGLGIISVPKVKETTLKIDKIVNDSWMENLVVNFAGVDLSVLFTHTTLQKNYTKVVLNKSFENTIAIKQVISTITPPGFPWPAGVPTTSQFDNFYAAGAGLIQRDVSDGSSQKLISYNIVLP